MKSSKSIRFDRAFKRLVAKHPELVMNLDWSTTVRLIATVQLALRHPDNHGETVEVVTRWKDRLIALIESQEPELAELLRLGDDPAHDSSVD